MLSSILSWPGLNGGKAQSVPGEMGSVHICLRRPLADAMHETVEGVDSGKIAKGLWDPVYLVCYGLRDSSTSYRFT